MFLTNNQIKAKVQKKERIDIMQINFSDIDPQLLKRVRIDIKKADLYEINEKIGEDVLNHINQDDVNAIIDRHALKNRITRQVDTKFLREDITKEKEREREMEKQIEMEKQTLKPKRNYIPKEISYFFVTLNPPECTIDDLKLIISKLSNRCWFKIHSYVFEQRGDTNETKGNGKHIHLIIEKLIRKSQVINNTKTALKKLFDSIKIDIREITINGKYIREQYMKGHKAFNKLECVKIDQIWRKDNNLLDFNALIPSFLEIDINEIKDDEKQIIEKEIDSELGFTTCKYKYKMGEMDNNQYTTIINNKINETDNKQYITIINDKGEQERYLMIKF